VVDLNAKPHYQALPKSDLCELLQLSDRSLRCDDENSFKQLVFDLQKMIGCDHALCAEASIPLSFDTLGEDISTLDISFPEGLADLFLKNKYYLIDNVVLSAFTNLSPVHWLSVKEPNPPTLLFDDHGMRDGWAHCTVDLKAATFSMFSLGGWSPDGSMRANAIVEYIIPFLSLAYSRVLQNKSCAAPRLCPQLSLRETEVLKWIKEGKSSWEISVILSCSKRVIDFHVSNIKSKLGAVTRAQCVAKSIAYGISSI
jgi:LuxR family transcriptional regulator, quorum-sensing system regulator CviR